MDFIPFTLIDLIDILLVAMIMTGFYRMTRGTNAPYIFTGIVIIYVVWVVVRALNMELLQTILGQIVSVGVLAVIIVFQPELRSFLQMIGRRQGGFSFINSMFNAQRDSESMLQPIITACAEMSAEKTGALIVIRQKDDLLFIIENGIAVDANLSVSLLKNIFFKNAPLHDGAAVIEGNRIVAAKCILPVTQSDVPKEYGTRHRSAIGLSELTDAVVVVVSEETGALSVVKSGQIKHNIDPQKFGSVLKKALGQK